MASRKIKRTNPFSGQSEMLTKTRQYYTTNKNGRA
jgi:hypothetical protein